MKNKTILFGGIALLAIVIIVVVILCRINQPTRNNNSAAEMRTLSGWKKACTECGGRPMKYCSLDENKNADFDDCMWSCVGAYPTCPFEFEGIYRAN